MRLCALVLVASILTASGCATQVVPTVAGGSRADGMVVLTGSYGLWRRGEIDWSAALDNALETCKGWGYKGAKPLTRYQWRCTAETPIGCANNDVAVRFQCTGPNEVR